MRAPIPSIHGPFRLILFVLLLALLQLAMMAAPRPAHGPASERHSAGSTR